PPRSLGKAPATDTEGTLTVTNPEANPDTHVCADGGLPGPRAARAGRAPVEIITARAVPLGGPRAMNVRRTLPQRQRSLIGAWCFIDHYGPVEVATTGGMDVGRHPPPGVPTPRWLCHVDNLHWYSRT